MTAPSHRDRVLLAVIGDEASVDGSGSIATADGRKVYERLGYHNRSSPSGHRQRNRQAEEELSGCGCE